MIWFRNIGLVILDKGQGLILNYVFMNRDVYDSGYGFLHMD